MKLCKWLAAPLAASVILTACGDGEPLANRPGESELGGLPSPTPTRTPQSLDQRPTAWASALPTKPPQLTPSTEPQASQPPASQPPPSQQATSAPENLSSIALPIQPPSFDQGWMILQEDWQTTTPVVIPFDNQSGSGQIGSFGDLRDYEMSITEESGVVTAPIRGLDVAQSRNIWVTPASFLQNFDGLGQLDRGVYCWAANGNEPLADARYEAIYTATGQMQVRRYGPDGTAQALLIDTTFDYQQFEDGPPNPTAAVRHGILCRLDDTGAAQIAMNVHDRWYLTTDPAPLRAGGGAGLIVRGRGGLSSVDTFAGFDRLSVFDATNVVLQ